MMVSQKCQYALRAMFELARRFGDGPVRISELASSQAIPGKFLEGTSDTPPFPATKYIWDDGNEVQEKLFVERPHGNRNLVVPDRRDHNPNLVLYLG